LKRSATMAATRARSAKSGQFVTKKFAKTHKATTVNERLAGGKRKSSRRGRDAR
jgi:hypothetical protein